MPDVSEELQSYVGKIIVLHKKPNNYRYQGRILSVSKPFVKFFDELQQQEHLFNITDISDIRPLKNGK